VSSKQASPEASAEIAKRDKYLNEYAASQKRELDETLRVSKLPGVTTGMRENASGRIEEYRKTLADIANEKDYMQRTGTLVPERSFTAAAIDQLKGAAAGTVRSIASIPSFLGAVGIESPGKASEAFGERIIQDYLAPDESDAAKFATFAQQGRRLSEAAGSVAPAVLTRGASRVGMALAGPRAIPAIARVEQAAQLGLGAGAGAQQQRQAIEQYEQETGTTVNPVVRAFAQALGVAIGASEVLTLDAVLARVPSSMRGSMTAKIASLAERVQVGGMSPKAAAAEARALVADIQKTGRGRVGVAAFEEGVQEGGAKLAQNVVERTLYNPEKDVTEGVGEEAMYGAIIGGGLRGGVELTNVLGKRAADNRKIAFEQIAAANVPIEEFDINVGSYEDPSQLTRQKIQRISEPDANGDVFARRADGTIYQTSLKELYRMRAPTEGIRAVPIPDTLSAPALTQRLVGALGNVEPDSDMQSYINSVTTTLNNNMALGTPEKTETYLQKQQNGLRRARLSEDAKIARMLVLDEAMKLNNEYVGLVTAPPEGAVSEGTDPNVGQEVANETFAPLSDEAIQSQIDSMREIAAKRAEALNAIAGDINSVDKVGTFEALMAQNGFDAPTTLEVASLYDAMRAESDAETAAGQEKDTSERRQLVDRVNIIESVLYDDRIPTGREEEILAAQEAIDAQIAAERAKLAAQPNKNIPAARRAIKNIEALEARRAVVGKAESIDAKLRKKGYKPLYRHEIERIGGFEAANAVFGPEGEYTQRRQALLDQVLADPTIMDKYRGFTELLDQNPALGDPTIEETRMLRGDAAPLEAQIAQSNKPITTAQLPAEPGGLPAEIIERDTAPETVIEEAPVVDEIPTETQDTQLAPKPTVKQYLEGLLEELRAQQAASMANETPVAEEAPATLEAIDAQIEAEQEKLDAAPNLGAPVARRAINKIKALKTERAAIEEAAPVAEETVVEEAAPVAEETVVEEAAPVAEETVAEEAAPVAEETVVEEVVQEPVQDEAPVEEETSEPTEAEQAVHNQLTEGEQDVLAEHYGQPEYNDVAKSRFIQDLVLAINNGLQAVSKKIRGIVKRIQVLTLATSVVFNANPLTTPSIPQAQAQAIVSNETLHRAVPTAARGEMSAEAQRVYELMAPVAIKTGKSFFIADKPNGMIHAFAGNGSYMVSAPSLYGKAAGDVLSRSSSKKSLDEMTDTDKVTPAGTFKMRAAERSGYTGGYVLFFDNPETGVAIGAEAGGTAIVAVHSVYTGTPSENRQNRLATATASDNKVSFGCINTAEDFFLDSVVPNIDSFDGGMVFVMPDDTSKTGQYFTGEQQKQQPSAPQEEQQKQVGILPGQKGLRQTRKEKKPDGEPTPPPPPPPPAPKPAPATEQPAPTATKQTINNPEEDISPVEEQLEADPTTVEGTFPASLNRPRAEAIGFAADLERRVKSIESRLRRRLEGKYKTAYDYSRALSAAYGVTKLPADLDVARKFELLESRKIGGQMQLNRWYLQPIEDKMIKLGVNPDDAAMYFWARSAPGRNALVRERNGEENGSGMSDAQAQAKLDQLEIEGLGPKLREIAKLHDALVDYMGNQRVKAGLLSKEAWRAMRKAQPFYTPLKGYALDGDMQVDGEPNPHSDAERGIAERNGTRVREVLTTRGRKSIPFNPLYNLMADAQFAIARIEQNKVKQTFLNNILSDPESHKDLVTVYTPKKKTYPSGHVTKPKIGPIGGGKSGPVDMNQLAAQPDANLMIVKKDGEPYYIEFAKTPAANALYRLFGNMTPKQVNPFFRGIDFKVDGKSYHIPGTIAVANTLKSFKTRFSPVFTLLVAPIRDIKEAITTAYIAQGIKGGPAEGTKLGKKTARYIRDLKGMGTISNYLRGNDPTTAEGQLNALLFDQFLEDGGAVGHAQVMESEQYAQNVAKNIKRYAALKRGNPGAAALKAKDMLAGALDHVSQLLDLHMRFATYRAALEEGISREDASALALDSTLDMTRRGELGPQLDSWAFFFSPTVGGARKLLSQRRYSAIARKLFTRLVGTGMLLYLFNRFGPGAGDDDEDGRPNILEVNNATAQTRVIFRYGPGINDYASVPTAFGLGFFNYVGGQIMATILGDIQPTEGATNIVGGFISLASPIKTEGTEGLTGIVNFAVPDTGQFISDLIFNRSAFGSPIYTEQEYSTLPKSELGREETGEVWKFVARGINSLFGGTRTVESVGGVQPEQYRYIAQQLLGGAYTFSRDIVDAVSGEAKPEQTTLQRIPLIKTFMGKGGEYAPMNKFYEDYDTLRSIHSTYVKSGEDPEAWAENKAAYPVRTDSRVMDAFDTALSEIRAINDAARNGAYDTSQEKYDALNDVYKEFNKTYSEVKKAK
jgi:hypothetical protein